MRLSTKGRYGVKALFELAYHYGSGPLSLKEIADRQGLSEHYLEQIAAPLRRAGLVTSVRGAQGGYTLGRPPETITVGEILRALEGPLELEEEGDQVGSGAWRRVIERVGKLLDSMTLLHLVEEEKEELARRNLVYEI
ncbi:RrF2 family transcriptional regulator [Caldinitratiruptor microaerophilus]|uniref:AsnC family transcriptional regulator n=1 Tax=Caldinitratiruptor microaerophilus TaxID=671077 RepID=A0AA35G9S3_9FIRM|nr:Rrf2 family transcriptional regulator [Caldinitratiruptor microaerophilus]BDG60589.1 AsnC family transcriptional regulator [Caldinitratiruptor microaerophilus]